MDILRLFFGGDEFCRGVSALTESAATGYRLVSN
jgi:hypothetical protein